MSRPPELLDLLDQRIRDVSLVDGGLDGGVCVRLYLEDGFVDIRGVLWDDRGLRYEDGKVRREK